MIAYLDTHIVVWLAQGDLKRLSQHSLSYLRTADLRISPVVLIELEYLYEIGRILLPARNLQRKLNHELDLQVCDLNFSAVADFALDEKWTRDPFDRMIVAQAKASGLAWLISSDADIGKNYPRTVW